MTISYHNKELQLTIYKILKEVSKWHNKDVIQSVGIIKDTIRGNTVIWQPCEEGLEILLDCGSAGAQASFEYKTTELFVTDIHFGAWPPEHPEGLLETLLLGLVKLYSQFKERTDAS